MTAIGSSMLASMIGLEDRLGARIRDPLRNRARSAIDGCSQNSTGETLPAEQLGELTGEHDRVARAQTKIAHRRVEVDVVGTAADVGHEVVGQPVPKSLLVVRRGHDATSKRLDRTLPVALHQIPLSLPAGADSTLSNRSSNTLLSESPSASMSLSDSACGRSFLARCSANATIVG